MRCRANEDVSEINKRGLIMSQKQTFFDWEDSLDSIENIEADLYTNDSLKISDIRIDKIEFYRSNSSVLSINLFTKQPLCSDLIKGEHKTYNLKIEIKLRSPYFHLYNSIILYDANFGPETRSYVSDFVETRITARRIAFSSDKEKTILKEWYGCNNKLNFHKGFTTSKTTEETIIYKNQKSISFKISNKAENRNGNSFWIKMDGYKFKVSVIKTDKSESEYVRYSLEYNEKWGGIPSKDHRYDISTFLSFIIGTKLIKFGESYFDTNYITQKEYVSPSPIDISFLYQTNFPFYNDDYRCNDTDNVIKQIPKMMRKYFLLKDQFRLDEVLPTLFVHSYLNFNFINYVTYIEMFANIEVAQKPTILPKAKFREVLKSLYTVKGVPKSIKDKYQSLNTIGVGKKVQRLLAKYKIDYSRYSDVFSVRGKVVHGANVDIQEMYMASEKAKELLSILTLKKLNYVGYIRNFTNNDELILIKDMSTLRI